MDQCDWLVGVFLGGCVTFVTSLTTAAADVCVNRTGEGCASPQVRSPPPHHPTLFRVLATSAALYFRHSHVWKVTLLAPRLPLTVTASTNVWFSVSGEKWAERIHRAFPRLFGRGVVVPAALFISPLLFTVSLLRLCADWWHCTVLHVPAPCTAETLCVPAWL